MGEDLHAFVVDIEIDKRFAAVGVRRFVAEHDEVAVAKHPVDPDIIERRAALRRAVSEFDECEGDGNLSGGDPFRRR